MIYTLASIPEEIIVTMSVVIYAKISTKTQDFDRQMSELRSYAARMQDNVVREALGLPENIHPLCVVPVGHPDGDFQPKDKWDPSKIHYNQWYGNHRRQSHGCAGRSDSSAQVLRNSRPEFRLPALA